ncbi:MAG: sugar phosphate isomerase/epimerase [Erysipelotrichaceae bacterium]|nr:sugar phosphate isomerase/epimerase [Erysipelotrichaceae bacterium]
MKLMVRAHDLGVKGELNILHRLNELNLDGIQLVAYKSLEDIRYVPNSMTVQRAEEIGSLIRSHQKEVGLVGAYFNPVHPNLEKIELGKQIFKEYIDSAKALGACAVGSETGSYQGEPWIDHPLNHMDEALDRVVEVFGELAHYAKEKGILLGMEGACAHVCCTPERLKEAVERIGLDNVRIIFDLFNFLNVENVHDSIGVLQKGLELFNDKILLFHLKDCILEDGKIKQCSVGKGILDYDRIIEMIYHHNPDAVLVFEGTVGEDLISSIEYIRCRMQKVSGKH